MRPSPEDLLDVLPDAVVVCDAGGRIVYANSTLERVLGWHPHELTGRDAAAELIPSYDGPTDPTTDGTTDPATFEKYVASGEPMAIEGSYRVALKHRDGSPVDVEVVLSAD